MPTTPTDKRNAYIHLSSRLIDAATRRGRFGLGVVDVISEQIPLDLNYAGILPHDPFISWISSTMKITMKNAGNRPDVRAEDFDVETNSGVVRYIGDTSGAWPTTRGGVAGPWNQTIAPYHSGTLYQIEENTTPFTMTASFKAGRFVITGVAASASGGSTQVTITDTTAVVVGREFYFSTDPVSEPSIDKRIITDVTGSVVTFTPALGYNLPNTAQFRQIDHAVRVACGYVISDLITYPPGDLKRFYKGLGQGALVKSWERFPGSGVVPVAVYDLLSPYIRI